MKPTNNLRFVERYAHDPMLGKDLARIVKILQQLWTSDIVGEPDEWRDVPLELKP